MTHTKIITTINLCGIGQSMLVAVSLVVAWFHCVFAAVVIVIGIQKNKNNNQPYWPWWYPCFAMFFAVLLTSYVHHHKQGFHCGSICSSSRKKCCN